MQVTLESTSTLERKMRISIPSEQVEIRVDAKLKEAAGQVNIKGFRPGKVPLREVRRRFGEGIRQEVSGELMQSSFSEALEQEDVSPAGSPQIEEVVLEAGKDLEFTAIFEVFPEIQLGDFAMISVEKPVAEVTPEDLDVMIMKLREQRLDYVEVDRPGRKDDRLNIDFEGFLDGEAFEGGTGEGADIVLGAGTMIPGFEDGLVGSSAGAERDLELKFPEEYQAENLAGKDALFKVKVNKVSEPELPELDEEFFKLFDVEEGGIEAFRTEVRGNMEKELDAAVKTKVRNQVLDGLIGITSVEVPTALVTVEVDRMREEAVQQFGGAEKIDPTVLPAEMFEKQAEKRVKLGLIVNAIVKQMDMKVDHDKVRITIDNMASSYEDPEQVVKYYYGNEQQLNRIENMVLEEQVVENVIAKADVNEITVPYDEAIAPAPQVVDEPEGVDEPAVDQDDQGDAPT
jgi:trigger factor